MIQDSNEIIIFVQLLKNKIIQQEFLPDFKIYRILD